jgi:two-component system cell cycle sensor histidine kinase/response regulator CckA
VRKLGKQNKQRGKQDIGPNPSASVGSVRPLNRGALDRKTSRAHTPRTLAAVQDTSDPLQRDRLDPIEAQDRLNQFAFDHAAELMMWIDGQGRCAFANQAALDVLGYSLSEFLKKRIWEIDPAMDAAKWDHFLKKLQRIGRARVDSLFRTRSGQERPFETVASHAKFDGRVFALICAHDASERQFAEGLRVLYAKELERQIAERDRTAGILRETEERVRLLLDSTAEAIFAKDSDGICALCNPACARVLGYDHPSELIGRNMHELMHHSREDGSCYPIEECPIHLSLQTGTALHGKSDVFWKRDGTHFPAEYWCYPMVRDGKNIGAVVTFFDVTERRRSEEQIRRLAAIVESSDDAIVGKKQVGNVNTWNTGAENMYGYSPGEAVGRHIGFLAVPGQEPAFEDVLSTTRRGDGVCQLEMQHRAKDEKVLHVSLTASPIRDTTGKIVGVSSITRDITQRRLAGEQIRQLAAIVESSQDAVIGIDLDGKISSWNSGAEQMYGYEAAEVVGQPVAFLAVPGREEDFEEVPDRIRSGNLVRHCETRRRAKDGKILDVSLTLSPIHDLSGKIVGISSIARNVSSERAIEQQYRQAQKMEAVGQLAGGVAHDFNNLLMIVHSCAQMILLQAGENKSIAKYAEQIRQAADRGAAVTTQLLAFSRKQPQDLRTMDLNHVIQQLMKMLPHLLRENVATEFIPRNPAARVRMDRGQVELAIMNLAINARDAMPNGGKLIIETDLVRLGKLFSDQHAVSVPPGSYVQLVITDTGIGMDAATQARIFEPFFTTKEVGKGTGLGLSTVYGIVKQNHGFIWVYSELGKGTTFKIYLPEVDQPAEHAVPSGTSNRRRNGNETILLAEDQAHLRDVLREFLSGRGYRVLAAANGAEALRIAEEYRDRIDLFLTDVVMPDARGPDVGRSIVTRHPETRVIFMSGYPHRSVAQDGWDSDAILLQKPFDIDTLEQKIALILGTVESSQRN